MYGFAKNERDNITQDELAAFKKAAKEYLSLTEAQITALLENQAITRGEVMSKTTQYKSDAFAAIHESMEALHQIGAISKTTMREFDETCLTPIQPMSPDDIRALRERENASQPVFARYLNVSSNLVSEWERGIKKPSGAAMRLLTIVYKKGLRSHKTTLRSCFDH